MKNTIQFESCLKEKLNSYMELRESQVQIASPNGHLCHIRRPLCDLIGGQLGTH